jgi:hypothetical protein
MSVPPLMTLHNLPAVAILLVALRLDLTVENELGEAL